LVPFVILFHFLCTQHVSDINISIIRSLRLCCWITRFVVLFSVRCVLVIWCGWVWLVSVLQAEVCFSLQHGHYSKQASACNTDTYQTQPHKMSNTQRTENKTTNVVLQQRSRKLLMMDILISEICWVHKKWNKIASDIKLVFYSSTITMMHGPINISCFFVFLCIWTLKRSYKNSYQTWTNKIHTTENLEAVGL